MSRYSILFIESGTSGGGSFESLYQHLRVINRQEFRPVVVYLNETRFVELVKAEGIQVYVLNDWLYSNRVPRYIRGVLARTTVYISKYVPACYLAFARLVHTPLVNRLVRIVRKERVDTIHLNVQPNRDLFGLFVAERTGVPCISHLRSMRDGNFDQHRAAYANRIVSAYIANSKMTKQYWEGKGIDPNKAWLVYNAIPAVDIRPLNVRKTWKIDNRASYVIGCVANFTVAKGHAFLLKAFAQFVKSRPDAILMLVGRGPLKNELIQQAMDLDIQDSVLFTGYDTRAKKIIAGLDLLVVPSKSETFGRVLLEAMQVRTPVVATNSGGIPEIVEHEYNGLLVDYGDEEALSKAIARVLTDKRLRSRFVQNGYRTVNQHFSIERYAAEIEQIYRDVLGQ